jgi:hypothetical protein
MCQGVNMCFHRQSSARRWRIHYTIRPFFQCSAVRLLQRSSSPHASASVHSPCQYESPCPCDLNSGGGTGGFLASSTAHPPRVGRLREQKMSLAVLQPRLCGRKGSLRWPPGESTGHCYVIPHWAVSSKLLFCLSKFLFLLA